MRKMQLLPYFEIIYQLRRGKSLLTHLTAQQSPGVTNVGNKQFWLVD